MNSSDGGVLRTLAYADVFDYPLSGPEIGRYLIGETRLSEADLQRSLKKMTAVGVVECKNGRYCLPGRTGLFALRLRREKWSRKKLTIAKRVAGWLKLVPWVKMVALTGALAMNNSHRDDDIDLLIVSGRKRLWLTRFFSVVIVGLVADRRRPDDRKVKDKICLNMFLSEDHLIVPLKERNLYLAHEVIQLKPLYQREALHQMFLTKNYWVKKYLPGSMSEGKMSKKNSRKKGEGLYPLFFDALEELAMFFQLHYMDKRRTSEVIEPGRILFHPQNCRDWVLKKYTQRLKKLKLA